MKIHSTTTGRLATITSVVQLPFLPFPARFATTSIPLDTQKSRECVANCLTPSLAIHHHSLTTTASPIARGTEQPTQNEEEEGKAGRWDQGQDRVQRWDLPALGVVVKFIH
jgi:hypothetical protein